MSVFSTSGAAGQVRNWRLEGLFRQRPVATHRPCGESLVGAERIVTRVEHLRDRFPADATDAEWIGTLGQEGRWIVLSADLRILRSPHNIEAWQRADLIGFFLDRGWLRLKFWDQAWRLIRRWSDIESAANLVAPGSSFLVPVKPSSKMTPWSGRAKR